MDTRNGRNNIRLIEVKKMELNKAIEALEGLIEPQSYTLGGYDKEALRTVLTELDRLQKESISKNKILDKMVEVKLEFFNNSKDNDSFNFAYSNEYAHIEEVLRELLEEGNNEQI